eukprot:334479-Prorocentrum_minimum.AAC.3
MKSPTQPKILNSSSPQQLQGASATRVTTSRGAGSGGSQEEVHSGSGGGPQGVPVRHLLCNRGNPKGRNGSYATP